MAQNVTTEITNFIRDTQWRVAELTITIDESRDQGDEVLNELIMQRRELLAFIPVVYESRSAIRDGLNFTSANANWTDREIIKEIEYLRNRASMNEVPWTSWALRTTELVHNINTGSGTFLPPGLPNQILIYDASGVLQAKDFPLQVGMGENETIGEFFQ